MEGLRKIDFPKISLKILEIVVFMKLKIQDTLYLRCRDKKILYYCYYAGYAFDIKKLIIFNDFKSVDQDDISILIQQEYIDEFINYKFKTKNKNLYNSKQWLL